MLLPPTGAGAAQLAGAWTHQSLTESLVFFFLHVQGLKMGRIQPISARQTLFHLVCAFTRVLFSFLTLSSRSIRCFSSDTRMLSLQDTSHQISEEPETWSKHHLLLESPLINSQRSFIRNWSWYLSNSEVSSALIETCVALSLWSFTIQFGACFTVFLYALYVSFYFQYSIQKFGVQAEKRQNTDFYPIFGAAFSLLNYNWKP